ncbi:MAG: acetate kinase [Bacteroidia bacterium]|nr:acetate kinase [Bacteroidia bacterium]
MKVLVLNCGSSSIKYQLFDLPNEEPQVKGVVEKIGLKGSFLKQDRNDGDKVILEGEILDHKQGIEYVLGTITSKEHGCISSLNEIKAVGHRVVHGGEKFNSSVFITDEVIAKMEECSNLAPLHNPPNLKGIYAINQLLPGIPQCGVFDTAFHQTMPDFAYMYAIPYSLYKKYSIRRYGFHGTSHRFVSKKACEILKLDYNNLRIITCHLGNGASIAAIQNGISVDTSMGFTPVEGLIMGTRCGDMDLGILTYIMQVEEIGISAANTLINKHSGMLGVSGVSSDMREITVAMDSGNERAKTAMQMYAYRVKKYIGSYAAAMGGVDLIVFTGGIGENDAYTRQETCTGLEFLGVDFDFEKNKKWRGTGVLTKPNSKVTTMVVETNEELVIALDTYEIINK